MNNEEKREYWKKHYETHKDYYKNYRESHKEDRKKYREIYKEYNKKYCKKYYENHKEEKREYCKNYRETHKDKYLERSKKYYESNKDLVLKFNKYRRYFRKNFSRFITLKNFVTIMKLEDEWLKKSIMTKLGKGTIDQDEAIMLSGMTFTEDDQKEMNEWWNICRCKSALYRKDLYIHNH